MKDAKQINIFGIFRKMGEIEVKWIILLFLMDECLRNPHFKIFFSGVLMLLASKLDPRGTPLG